MLKFHEIVDRPSERYLRELNQFADEMLLMTRDKLEPNKDKLHKLSDLNDRAIQLLATRLGVAQTVKLKLDDLKRKYPIS
jgi:hypothetical protein